MAGTRREGQSPPAGVWVVGVAAEEVVGILLVGECPATSRCRGKRGEEESGRPNGSPPWGGPGCGQLPGWVAGLQGRVPKWEL